MKKKRKVTKQLIETHSSFSPSILKLSDQQKLEKLESDIFDAILYVVTSRHVVISPKNSIDKKKIKPASLLSTNINSDFNLEAEESCILNPLPARSRHGNSDSSSSSKNKTAKAKSRREDSSLERLITEKLAEWHSK